MFLKVVVLLMAVCFAVASVKILAGAPVDADITKKDVSDALQFAVVQYNQAIDDVYLWMMSKVIRAQTQVVAGIKYIFKVEMSRTTCKKGGAGGACLILSDPKRAKTQVCKFEVWSRPWLKSTMLVKNTCV